MITLCHACSIWSVTVPPSADIHYPPVHSGSAAYMNDDELENLRTGRSKRPFERIVRVADYQFISCTVNCSKSQILSQRPRRCACKPLILSTQGVPSHVHMCHRAPGGHAVWCSVASVRLLLPCCWRPPRGSQVQERRVALRALNIWNPARGG
jgi:hypothetical protein